METIRYYERIGLLPRPARSAGGFRLYTLDHLKRLTFIRRARALGFTIEQVTALLRLADERKRPCQEVWRLATAHLEEIRAKVRALRAMERVLQAVVAQCADGRRPECPVIEAWYREPPAPEMVHRRNGGRERARSRRAGASPERRGPKSGAEP